jgi:hypothetical protein
MIRSICLIILIVLFGQSCFSQIEIKGKVIDSLGTQKIKGALIMALRMKDSTLIDFTRTNNLGEYKLQNLPLDTFEIIIGHPKFDDNHIYVFGNKNELKIELPPSMLLKKANELKEIVIHANNRPIYFKGDTLVFVADSFKVKERAVVEDLLRKLPGVKVDINGKITYQGKSVDRMYVDGDEFFGKDPTIATKNLEATMIDQVQVFEQGANSEKVMNLTLKEDAKKGTFGKSAIATDGQKFYEGEALFNKYRKKENIAFYILKNNTPRSGFDYEDATNIGSNNYMYTVSGFPDNLQTGVNYKNNFGKEKKHKIKVGYNFENNTIKTETNSSTINYIQDTSLTTVTTNDQKDSKSLHKIFVEYNWTIDSLTKLSIEPTLYIKQTKLTNENTTNFLNNKQLSYRNSLRNFSDSSTYNSFSNTSYFEKNYRKKSRKTYISNVYAYNNQNTINNTFFNSTDIFNLNTDYNQQFENKNLNYSSKTVISHSESILKNFELSPIIKSTYSTENQKQYTYNKKFNSLFIIDSLSSDFNSKKLNNEYGLTLSYKRKNHYFSISNIYNTLSMKNENINSNENYTFNYANLLPNFSYYYTKRSNLYISLSANKTIKYPTINQLQPVLSNKNPNYRYIGNPNLTPSISNNINFELYKSFPKMGEYFNLTLNSNFINSEFVESITYNSLGVSTTKTMNMNGVQNHSLSTGINKFLYKNKLMLNTSFSNEYNIYQSIINSNQIKTEQLKFSPNIGLDYYGDTLMISFNNTTTYNKPIGAIYSNSSTPYYQIDNVLSFDWTPKLLGLLFKGNINQSITTGRAQGYNINRTLINFSIGKEFLTTKNLKVSFEVNDLLNQNKGISRTQINNQIIDTKSNIISRYILLRITYRFLKVSTSNS